MQNIGYITLQVLHNIGYIPHVVQYILVAGLVPSHYTSHTPTLIVPLLPPSACYLC